jgi:phytoene desaturase
MEAEVARLSPGDLEGFRKFLKDAEARYWFGFEDLGRRSMHKLWDLVKVLPKFAMMRADRSVYAHAARRVKDEHGCASRCRSIRCSSGAIRST